MIVALVIAAPCVAAEPAPVEALYDLFGVVISGNTAKLPSGETASLWFDHRFALGNDAFAAFFVAYPDASGCHACTAKVGAITYRRAGDGWTIVAKQPSFAAMGSWGEAPPVGPHSPVGELLLAPGNVALLIGDGGTGQGVTNGGESLLGFRNGAWKSLGFIDTSGDNGGACGDQAAPNAQDRSGCYSYKGTISVVGGAGRAYPDLLVRHTGTARDDSGNIVRAPDALYKFDGVQYRQITGPNF